MMMNVLRATKKAIAGGFAAAAAAAGIVVADLDWPAIIAAFLIGLVGVFFAPANETQES